jgi:ATP-dependent Clp protease ATP-binding subunit ClpC
MHEPLSESARNVLDQAQHEARRLNQEFVGTEHLALAVMSDGNSDAMKALVRHQADPDALAEQLRRVLQAPDDVPVVTGRLPLSARAQRALNSAIVLARSLREPVVSTRHLLAALLSESNTLSTTLKEAGVDVDALVRGLTEHPTLPEEQ